MFMDRKDFKLLYEAAMQSVAPAQQPAAPAPVQQQPAAPAPAQQPADIQLQPNGKTSQGANQFRVMVNGIDMGGCTEYNGAFTFANANINSVLGTTFQFPEVTDKTINAMQRKQFNSEAELKQNIQNILNINSGQKRMGYVR